MGLVRDVRVMLGLLGEVDRKLDVLLVSTAPALGHDDVREIFETLFEAHVKLDESRR